MRGNFSLTQFPTSETGTLWIQQGRPLLDSDWNAQATLAEEAVRKKIESLVGPSGAPVDKAGFKITPIIGISINNDPANKGDTHTICFRSNKSLPFSLRHGPARPFHMQIGFMLANVAPGTLCDIPGFFTISITRANKITVTAAASTRSEAKDRTSSTGKTVIAPRVLQRIDVVYDGETIDVYLSDTPSSTPEASLPIGCPPFPSDFPPLALQLGGTLIKNTKDNSFAFEKPLVASFWHFSVLDDFLAFAQNMPLGEKLDDEHTGLVCSVDFNSLHEKRLTDRTGKNKDALLFPSGNKIPEMSLLDIIISAGDYIVQGRFYQNPQTCLSSDQPNLPQRQIQSLDQHNNAHPHMRFFLDCWQRMVTDLDAPANHDPALGNIDTTTDLRNIWQVKAIGACDKSMLDELWQQVNNPANIGEIKLRHRSNYLALQNGLLRVEIHHSGWAATWPVSNTVHAHAEKVELADKQRHTLTVSTTDQIDILLQLDRPVMVYTADKDAAAFPAPAKKHKHVITTVAGITPEKNRCRIDLSDAVPKPHKNQQLFILPLASFKFSTKNGCLSYPVANLIWLEGETGLSADMPFPGYNGLEIKNGDWMELRNLAFDQTEQPGPFFCVTDFMQDQLQLLLSPHQGFQGTNDQPVDAGEYPTLTLWSGISKNKSAPLISCGWIELAEGIEVEFKPDSYYKSGQYWTTPLRDAAPTGLLWPSDNEDKPIFQPPQGPHHNYVALADIICRPNEIKWQDSRRLFRSLVNEPFADLDDKTALVLLETAGLMEWLDLPKYGIKAKGLEQFTQEIIRNILDGIYEKKLRVIGTKPDAPEGLISTGQEITIPYLFALDWWLEEEIPEGMCGNGFGAELAGQPVYINQANNSIWAYRGDAFGWHLLTHIPDERHAYSVTSDSERLYIVGGWHKGLLHDGAAKHVIALNSMGEWHTVGTMNHYAGYPATICIGDNLLVAGGVDHEGDHVSDVGYVDLKRREWHDLDHKTPHIGAYTASIAHEGVWLILGGELKHPESGKIYPSDHVHAYDPVSRIWLKKANLPTPLAGHQIIKANEGFMLIGGKRSETAFSNACYHYDPVEDRWQHIGDLSETRAFFGAMIRKNKSGRHIAAVGGMVEEGLFAAHADVCSLDQTFYLYK